MVYPVGVSNETLPSYDGEWTIQQAAHLLKRCTFGPKIPEIQSVLEMGREAAIEQLLSNQALPDPPVNYYNESDPVPIGQTWVFSPVPQNARTSRRRSMLGWTILQQLNAGLSIREKMTLFWHNHFAVESQVVNDARFLYQHQTVLRTNALGNFRKLVKDITIDPTMLRYLDGRLNTKNKPNENFGRELLELFTIGKGPLVGPGDYTHYTEEDVVAFSRALTGWRDYGYNSDEIGSPYVTFRSSNHDTSAKQLSARFEGKVLEDAGAEEYAQVVDIILEKDEVARFICRKLYRWFVNYEISDVVEEMVIEPLANLFRTEEYEIKPVLNCLLNSAHFYEQQYCGAIIKNPIDYTVALLRQGQVSIGWSAVSKYSALWKVYQLQSSIQMAYFGPPTVAGWPAYYQEPVFYQSWVNSATLPPRVDFAEDLLSARGWQSVKLKMDVLQVVAGLESALDPNLLIEDLSWLWYPLPLSDAQKQYLKEVLIPGLPDFEWTVEYGEYLANPDDVNLAESVEQRLLGLFRAMINLPEIHLS